MMSDSHLTAGAERALAALRLHGTQSELPLFDLLLDHLLHDEGRATEILREAGVEFSPMPRENASVELRSYSEWQRTLIRQADHFVVLTNSNDPTGTEHLLLAALSLDAELARRLAPFGVTEASVLTQVTQADPELSGPEQALVQITPANQGLPEGVGLSRILDASANRAREGLRVVEDYVRFHLDDALLSGELKSIRHLLTRTLSHLGQAHWISSRDTLHDVGTLGTLASERQRGSLSDVLRANLKRIEEALRTLEEYGKLIDSQLSLQISQCRYRMYTVEKGLETAIQSRQRLAECRLYLLVTAADCRYGAEQTIRHSVEKGVDVVQLREKQMSDREFVRYARRVREWTADAGTLLIINDRPDLAVAAGADGVHLGQDDLDVQAARRILGRHGLIGVSTHSPEQAQRAIFEGADYLGVGPVFPSATKDFSEFPGLDYVRYVAKNTCLPWFAIGGINAENLPDVLQAGGERVAVSSVICRAPHPQGVTETLKALLSPAGPQPE